MAGTFTGQTLTDTGQIGTDTLDPSDKFFGFGNLITSDGGKAINSTSPFQGSSAATGMKYSKIVGIDVKLVHGDRWQELEGLMTEDVASDFTTTIGKLGKPIPISNSDLTGSTNKLNVPSDFAGDVANTSSASGVFSESEPTQEITAGNGNWNVTVGANQTEKIGGDINLNIGGSSNKVQIGPDFASFFSPFVHMGQGPQDWHWVADSYQMLSNDYKIVTDTKYRKVHTKEDYATSVNSSYDIVISVIKLLKLSATLANVNATGGSAFATGVSVGVVPVGCKVKIIDAVFGFQTGPFSKLLGGFGIHASTPFS
ncbi:MAG TPA: hypothetical protein VMU80_15190 [Bryobacteraceae bacterium]|nr:hypothetical protein [Bryobacteraceae bacterium]